MKKIILSSLFFCLSIVLFVSCEMEVKKQKNDLFFKAPGYFFPYNLQKPDKIWRPSHKLREISGLSFASPDKIASIQDEKGYLFLLDTIKGKTSEKIKFAKDGDYEGVEIVGDDAWIIKSNGDLYQLKNYKTKRQSFKHKTPLSKHNNVEGLAYDASDNSLLIACKGYPFLKKQKRGKAFKTVYKFDLNRKQLIEKPFLLLSLDSLKKYKYYSKSDEMGIKVVSKINESEGDPTFQPSAIAIHPLTKNIYILSSVGKTLLVVDTEGQLKLMMKLNPEWHPQPEGICFEPNGTLYISNEGKKSRAKIIVYKKQ